MCSAQLRARWAKEPLLRLQEGPLFDHWKNAFRQSSLFQKVWGGFRSAQLRRSYVPRREYYARLAREQGLVYHKPEVVLSTRNRLQNRGYTPPPRQLGEIHTFAFLPIRHWQRQLLPDLQALGPLTLFDPESLGFNYFEFAKADRSGIERRRAMNDMVLPALRAAHAQRPVDWFFVYATGLEISANLVRQVIDEFGIPTVSLCLDDKHAWIGPWMGDHRAGQIDIASVFDLSWTSSRIALEWYLSEGGRPIYMPEGFDASTYRPKEVHQDIPVSFIGAAYGYRPDIINYLLGYGIQIQTFGSGWPHSSWASDITDIINRSQVNLGLGGIGYSEYFTNLKARDFEIPGTGGGVYITSFNPDLAQHFDIGKEILCYSHRDELLELIRYYLTHPDEAQAIAQRGRERCLREHRWLHRYKHLLEIIGILPE